MENFINSWKVDLKEGISDQLSNLIKISLLEYLKGELKEVISELLLCSLKDALSVLQHFCHWSGISQTNSKNAATMKVVLSEHLKGDMKTGLSVPLSETMIFLFFCGL